MSLKKSFILALSNILYDKVRSLLTMLGIIIGVAAVIILISLMDGMTGMITDQFEEIGTRTINISVTSRGGSRTIEPEALLDFAEENRDLIDSLSPSVTVPQATVKAPGSTDSITTTATGVGEEYVDVGRLTVTQGRFLQFPDVEHHQKVCVIGTYIQQELFGFGQALGQKIKINGDSFKVVGILEEKEDSESGSADEVIYIPYTTAINYTQSASVSSYTAWAVSDDTVEPAVSALEALLEKQLGDSDYYRVNSMKEIMDMASDMTGTMKTLLVCIAGISLLVGGIGIMNIMLVSVTERTREIGIRKSLGAKGRDIMSQFVIEAGTVSGVGGVIGIVVGGVLSVVAGNALGLSAYPSVSAIFIAFGVSVGIGILFGYLPAKNAARLNPIEALRHE